MKPNCQSSKDKTQEKLKKKLGETMQPVLGKS